MKLVYIAGPFTAETDEEIEANILAAEELARRIVARTDKVACLVPHSIGRNFKRGPGSPQYWYDATMRMLEPCDALITAGDWRASKGTRNEVIASHECCRSVFHSEDDLIAWAELGKADHPALIAEIERLRAENRRLLERPVSAQFEALRTENERLESAIRRAIGGLSWISHWCAKKAHDELAAALEVPRGAEDGQ